MSEDMETIRKIWGRIYALNEALTDGDISFAFDKSLGEARIRAIEGVVGFSLPEQLRESYLVYDGVRFPRFFV